MQIQTIAQCSTAVKNYPYSEGFESGTANWFTGGNASSWAWGMPNKPVIKTAGSGTNCWMNGGLTGGFYPNGESSWLQSPCFDFSGLSNPFISFKIFWNTERVYDGVTFQYSTDGGNSWQVLGSVNDNISCPANNWFNTPNSNSLPGGNGWTGNLKTIAYNDGGTNCGIGGGPSNWVTAQHSLSILAGKPNVLFRFFFGAGTKCNDFDGVAIDDIYINETPALFADYTYTCSTGNAVSFTTITAVNCPVTYSWDFGDPASGNNNQSASANPSHLFSANGTYLVTENIRFADGSFTTIRKNITLLNVLTSVVSSIDCNGNATGAVKAIVSGGNGPYTYNWNTTPAQSTSVAVGLKAGTYAVVVGAANACQVTSAITLTEPAALTVAVTPTQSKCKNTNGAINTNVTGGTVPYTYAWSNGQATPVLTNIKSGVYALKITDANHCIIEKNNILVADTTISVPVFLGNDTLFCPGNQLVLAPGVFSAYLWQDYSAAPNYVVNKTGKYWVRVTDGNGCSGTGSINVVVDCSDIYFPSGFTPNGDGKNDVFGAIGNLAAVKNYTLTVYGRWGEIVFQSSDPYKKWDGNMKSLQMDSGVYVWVASYSFLGSPQIVKKGTVVIIR